MPKKQRAATPRGRPREYDPNQALARATEAFWRAGYSATSVDDLSIATNMNRPSLYGAFGDKRALYLTTLSRYVTHGRRAMEKALSGPGPLRDALMRVYEGSLALYYPSRGPARGCFLIGTAATEAVNDPDVRAVLREGLREFDRQFKARIERSKVERELDEAADSGALAAVCSAILHTLALRSRAGDSVASLRATAHAGVDLICGRRTGKS